MKSKTAGNTADTFKQKHSLKYRLDQVEAELTKAKRESIDATVIKEAIGAIATNVETLTLPVWADIPPNTPSAPGVPTLFLSDWHWGEIVYPSQINHVNRYNLAIAQARLEHTVNTAIDLLRRIDSQMRYPGIVVPLGGDMISGDIHEELKETNELPTMPALLDIIGHLLTALTRLADQFGSVFVPCVTGNHGRNTKKIYAKNRHYTSFDWLIYRFLAKMLQTDKRITFHIPDGNDANYRIYSTRYLLTHGDKLGKGGDGLIGFLGPVMRGDNKKRARNTQINLSYDVMIAGHWHQYAHLTRVIVNGSGKGYDEYASEENFSYEVPQQALWLTHPVHGITYRMPVYCEASTPKLKSSPWVAVPSQNQPA